MTARGSACVLLMALGAAGAQSPRGGELRREGGAAQVRQKGRDARAAAVAGGLWRQSGPRLAALASGSFTWAGDSVTAAQAITAAAWRPSPGSAWHTEGGVTGAAFGVYALGRGHNLSAYLRERVAFGGGSVWMGGSAGHTKRDGQSWHSTLVDLGASLRKGGYEASLSFARLRTNDWPLMQASEIFLKLDAAAHDLEDVILTMRYTRGRFAVDGGHTWRGGRRQTLARQTALLWSASCEISPRLSFAVGGGRQLADAVRGVPDATIASAVIRIVALPWPAADAGHAAATATARLVSGPDGAVLVVRVLAADSARVEVAGSFSEWEPVAARRVADAWEARIPLRAGSHRVAVRVNGGPWRAPANLGKVRDGFGGEAGIVVVP